MKIPSHIAVPARSVIQSMEAVMWDSEMALRRAHAENLGLRALLEEHGIIAPGPVGVATLRRMHALENVLDLARQVTQRGSGAGGQVLAELRRAVEETGRQP